MGLSKIWLMARFQLWRSFSPLLPCTLWMLYSHDHDQLYIHIYMQKHNDAMKTSGHSSLEKYTSHFIWKGLKGLLKILLRERWVGDWTELQYIDPNSYGHNSVSFPFSCSTGVLGAQPLWDMVLIPASSLQLTWGSELQLLNRGSWGPPLLGAGSLYSILSPTNSNFLCTVLYYCFTPTQFNLSTVKVIPLIPSTGYTCYLHWCISYFDSSAGVNMQHEQE